ncbi:MAG: hypothetical protein JKY37_28980 [Nannocystaceae bacterium]|nr:hypothetical protein [Nannocystaceae bacterium]
MRSVECSTISVRGSALLAAALFLMQPLASGCSQCEVVVGVVQGLRQYRDRCIDVSVKEAEAGSDFTEEEIDQAVRILGRLSELDERSGDKSDPQDRWVLLAEAMESAGPSCKRGTVLVARALNGAKRLERERGRVPADGDRGRRLSHGVSIDETPGQEVAQTLSEADLDRLDARYDDIIDAREGADKLGLSL